MKVGICDSDVNTSARVAAYLSNITSNDYKNVEYMCYAPNEVIFDIDEGKYDCDVFITEILFESEEYSGIDIAKKINVIAPMCRIIYYARRVPLELDIYEARHTSCLIKGPHDARLGACVQSVIGSMQQNTDKSTIKIRFDRTVTMLPCSKIHYIRIENRVTKFYTDEGEYYEYKPLTEVMEELPDNFVRCHNAAIINMDYVKSSNRSRITMIDGELINIGRRYGRDFMKAEGGDENVQSK